MSIAAGAGISVPLSIDRADAAPAAALVRAGDASAIDLFAAEIIEASRRFGVPTRWITAVMHVESAGVAKAFSPNGALGLMQIMPDTYADVRVRYGLGADPTVPRDNILAGAALLRELHDRYGSPGFLAAYNAGSARYQDHIATGRALPPETRRYVDILLPMIGAEQSEDAIKAASVRLAWMQAPLFIAHADSRSADTEPAADVQRDRPTPGHRVVDDAALKPRSDALFVRCSNAGRQQ